MFFVPRAGIPQPGVFAHFHWINMPGLQMGQSLTGYLLQLTAVDRFCFVHHEADKATTDLTCSANGGVAIDPGPDLASHLNIVAGKPPGS